MVYNNLPQQTSLNTSLLSFTTPTQKSSFISFLFWFNSNCMSSRGFGVEDCVKNTSRLTLSIWKNLISLYSQCVFYLCLQATPQSSPGPWFVLSFYLLQVFAFQQSFQVWRVVCRQSLLVWEKHPHLSCERLPKTTKIKFLVINRLSVYNQVHNFFFYKINDNLPPEPLKCSDALTVKAKRLKLSQNDTHHANHWRPDKTSGHYNFWVAWQQEGHRQQSCPGQY